MKSTKTENIFKYKGNVVCKFTDKYNKKHTIKQHNSGETGLLNLFIRSLANQADLSSFVPSYIVAYNSNSETSTIINIYTNTNAIVFENNKQSTLANNKILTKLQYTFSIPIDVVKDDIYKYVLYNNQNQKCASVDLSSIIRRNNLSSNILVYWQLTLNIA